MSQIVIRHGAVQGLVSQPLAHCDTNEQLLNLWLHGKSSSSVEAYRRDISYFLAFVGDKPVWEVTLNDVIGFASALESKGYSPATRRRRLSTVKSILTFGHRIGVLPVNVGFPVTLPKPKEFSLPSLPLLSVNQVVLE